MIRLGCVDNQIFYYANSIFPEKQALMEALHVQVIVGEVIKNDYAAYHSRTIQKIASAA